jgi:hypothetical protein
LSRVILLIFARTSSREDAAYVSYGADAVVQYENTICEVWVWSGADGRVLMVWKDVYDGQNGIRNVSRRDRRHEVEYRKTVHRLAEDVGRPFGVVVDDGGGERGPWLLLIDKGRDGVALGIC